MTREKRTKPLFEVKSDFYESLDAFVSAVIFLRQQVRSVVELGCLDSKPEIKRMVVERLIAVERTMSLSEEPKA